MPAHFHLDAHARSSRMFADALPSLASMSTATAVHRSLGCLGPPGPMQRPLSHSHRSDLRLIGIEAILRVLDFLLQSLDPILQHHTLFEQTLVLGLNGM